MTLEHMLNNLLGRLICPEAMFDNLGDSNLMVCSESSYNMVGLNTMEDVMNASKDVSSGVDHSTVGSHHVSIMVSDEASFS